MTPQCDCSLPAPQQERFEVIANIFDRRQRAAWRSGSGG